MSERYETKIGYEKGSSKYVILKLTGDQGVRHVLAAENKNWHRNIAAWFWQYTDKNEIMVVQGGGFIAVDPEETVFVNIVGEINMNAIGKLGNKFNIPKLDSVKTEEYQ